MQDEAKSRQPGRSAQAPGRNGPERPQREQTIVRNFRAIYQAIQRHSAWVEKTCGVSAAQLWAMWELSRHPGQRVSDLSGALAIHASTASNMLDKLESKNLVERRRNGPDQRVVRVYLTRQGKSLLAGAPRPAQGALVDALHRLSDSQLANLDRCLQRLAELLGHADAGSTFEPMD